MRLLRGTLLVGILSPSLWLGAQEGHVRTSAPVQDYAISFFSDEGYPRVRVVGASADLSDTARIELTLMELILYTGGIDRDVETTLSAPIAILEPEPEIVHGPAALNLERADLTLSGEDWSYEHREQRVLINRNARVVFKMPLEGLIE